MDLLSPCIQIVSNFLLTSLETPETTSTPSTAVLTRFSEPLIHVLNKNEAAALLTHPSLKEREMIILLGDSMGDLGMSKGLSPKEIITIGFCNYEEEKLLEVFKKEWDVVITGDPGLEWVMELFSHIYGSEHE